VSSQRQHLREGGVPGKRCRCGCWGTGGARRSWVGYPRLASGRRTEPVNYAIGPKILKGFWPRSV